ncbi:MAG: type I phosphomannose isomerase catalytic subunit [Sandaracinaceae bacterium]
MGALAPLLLSPDNFTPPSRTPWGGTRIVRRYKAGLGLTTTGVVGESWELSVTPEFPSRLADGRPLAEVLAADPPAMLGREARRGRSATALLVKLLDTAAPLSVQIHPPHGHPGLEPSEAGKPESWYVLDAAPGAGVHLGLRRGVTPQRLRAAIDAGEDLSALLFFVPVEPGDVFLIRAGTAHAIGPGITLVEPQHVAPGRRGVTYRFWDWNRRYDATGRPDRSGRPRELHVEAALAVTDWDAPREDALLAEVRLRLGAPDRGGGRPPRPVLWRARGRAELRPRRRAAPRVGYRRPPGARRAARPHRHCGVRRGRGRARRHDRRGWPHGGAPGGDGALPRAARRGRGGAERGGMTPRAAGPADPAFISAA